MSFSSTLLALAMHDPDPHWPWGGINLLPWLVEKGRDYPVGILITRPAAEPAKGHSGWELEIAQNRRCEIPIRFRHRSNRKTGSDQNKWTRSYCTSDQTPRLRGTRPCFRTPGTPSEPRAQAELKNVLFTWCLSWRLFSLAYRVPLPWHPG